MDDATVSNNMKALVFVLFGPCWRFARHFHFLVNADAPFATNSIGFVRTAYAVANVTKDYMNAPSAKEALMMATNEPGWVGSGTEAFIPLGAVVFWYACCAVCLFI